MSPSLRNILFILLAIGAAAFAVYQWGGGGPLPTPPVLPTQPSTQPQQTDKPPTDDPSTRKPLNTQPEQPQATGKATGSVRIVVHGADAQPVANCKVSLGEGFAGTTDKAGAAAFELPPQRVWVDVMPPDDSPHCSYKSRLTVDRGLMKDIVVVLAPKTREVWCRIVGADDKKSLADATLVVHPRDLQVVNVDARGIAKLALQPGDEFAVASAPGRASRRIALVAGHTTDATLLDVPLESAAAAEVTCFDAKGQPIADVMLTARALASDLQWPRGEAPVGSPQSWSARSDAEGKLALAGVPANTRLFVEVLPPNGAAAPPTLAWQLKPGANTLRVDLPSGNAVRGRVIDGSGRPVANARIACVPTTQKDVPTLFPSLSLRGDPIPAAADGTFELPQLAAGAWLIGLYQTEGWAAPCVRIEVGAAGAADVELHADRELAITGRLLGAGGAPISAFEVRAERDGVVVASAITEDNGAFRLAPLLAGEYDVTTELYGNDLALPAPMKVRAGSSNVDVRVDSVCGSVRGRVHTTGGGELWLLAFRRGGDESSESLCDADGGFFLETLRSGTWEFVARDARGNTGTAVAVEIKPGVTTEGVEITLARGGVLRPLHAEADACQVLRGAAVFARLRLESGLPAEVQAPAGDYTVRFLRQGLELVRKDVTLRAGDSLTVDGAAK